MRTARLEDMRKGWFVGDFEPTLYRTRDCEVAVKYYRAGDHEARHYHKVATEITVIVSGTVEMNGIVYRAGDIIIEEPGDVTDFTAVTDAVNAVVKLPCVAGDKYTVGAAEEEEA